ncbi:MAG: hypothetical protein AAFY56_14350 [Pseudomonadota bacterium]
MSAQDLTSTPITFDRDPDRSWLAPGVPAFIGAAASLVTCYGTLFAASFVGVEIAGGHAHAQAVVMWAFGEVALHAMWSDRKNHRRNLPLAIGFLAIIILLGTLYIQFDRTFEILSYVLLIIAALLNQNAIVGSLYERVQRQASEDPVFDAVSLALEIRTAIKELSERWLRLATPSVLASAMQRSA